MIFLLVTVPLVVLAFLYGRMAGDASVRREIQAWKWAGFKSDEVIDMVAGHWYEPLA